MKLWELLQATFQSPIFGSALGLIGIGLAFFFGFYQNKLNHFNRKRYIRIVKEQIGYVPRAATLTKYNLHTSIVTYESMGVLLFAIVGSTSIIVGYVTLFSSEDLSFFKALVCLFSIVAASYCYYTVATRLMRLSLLMKAILVPWTLLSDLKANLDKNSTAALLSDTDRRELMTMIDAEKRDWLMDEKT